jgi:hypothetical protein
MDHVRELNDRRELCGYLFQSELFHLPRRLRMPSKYFQDLDVRDETKLSNQVSKSNV